MVRKTAPIGIIGGSGFYDLASNLKEVKVETPYGRPSEKVALGKIVDKKVAFLPRHNKTHDLPPHQINYRANIWALHSLGVRQIVTATACGSLQAEIKPGDFVILDQFVDRTRGRKDTFYNGPISTHISSVDPYCPSLRKLACQTGKELKISLHSRGTVVVVNGPRFSTKAESDWFAKMGWHVINMTQYPEVILAREKEICYTALALVTDWDAGLRAGKKVKPVSAQQVGKIFKKNIDQVKKLILAMIKNWSLKTTCSCQQSLKEARF